MTAIDEAMKVIEANTYGDAEGSKLIRQQLEAVAKAARREAARAAQDIARLIEQWNRAMTEEANTDAEESKDAEAETRKGPKA